jgi:hypothetical protein
MDQPPTLEETVDQFLTSTPKGQRTKQGFIEVLRQREDQVADYLRLCADQLGTYPEFVAFVMAQARLGTPVDDYGMALLHQQFHSRMEWLREQLGGGGDDPST